MTAITTHESIELVPGDTWEINGTIQDEAGAAMLLTDIGINWKLDTMDGNTNLLDMSVGSGIEIVDEAAGAILIKVTPDMSTGIPPGIYYDWLRITLPDGSRFTEWTGIIMVIKEPKPTINEV